MEKPCIYVVATPIGCLADISERAKSTLAEVDLIVTEDTRTTRKLLSAYGIRCPELVSYFDGAELSRAEGIAKRIERDHLAAALVSEAGTPAISDPGYQLIRIAHQMGLKVSPIPGASAPATLASAAGLPSDRILFVGFLPTKASAIEKEIRSWYGGGASVIFLESARRLEKTLAMIAEQFPAAEVAIGRELTKMHEEIKLLSIADAQIWVQTATLKGELTIMVGSSGLGDQADEMPSGSDLDAILRAELQSGLTLKDLLKRHRDSGGSRTELYQKILKIKEDL